MRGREGAVSGKRGEGSAQAEAVDSCFLRRVTALLKGYHSTKSPN